MITPFRSGRIDESRLREQIEFQISAGIDALIPAGTTGEAPTLEPQEHRRLIELTVLAARGRAAVIAGAGGNSTAEAMHRHSLAKEIGATGCLSVTPYYNKPSQEGLFRHFMMLADKVDLPIMLYNVPSRTGVNLTPQTIARLAQHPNIVAIKEASGSLDAVSEIRSLCHITILCGDDSLTLPMLSIGARGVVSVVSNIFPSAVKRLTQLAGEGGFSEAAGIHHQLFALTKSLFADGNPAGIKWAMRSLKRDTGELRLPLVEASAKAKSAIDQHLRNLELKQVA